MKKYIKIHLTGIILIIFCFAIFSSCSDSSKPYKYLTLSITPAQDSIFVGDTINFKVKIQDATDLYGFHLEIGFDSTRVEIPANFWSMGEFWSGHSFLNDSYQYSSKFSIVVILLGEGDGISGSGELFNFSLRGISEGISELEIIENSSLYLVDNKGELIEEFDNLTINNANLIIK